MRPWTFVRDGVRWLADSSPRGVRPSHVIRGVVRRRTGDVVQSGPFAGLRFVSTAVWGAYVPKLLGTYERELHPQLAAIVALAPDRVVDVGAAEGYYAVGLAQVLPEAHVIAFEQMPHARELVRSMASQNGVGARVDVRGSCDASTLSEALEGAMRPVVVCDVEGYERELIDPERVPALRGATLLVEVHDSRVPDCSSVLRERFEATHQVEHIRQEPRRAGEYPYDDLLRRVWPRGVVRYALNEFRSPGTGWLWMTPRAGA